MKKNSKKNMKRQLFKYMVLLGVLLLMGLVSGLFVCGQFTGTKGDIYKTLDFQLQVFERDIEAHYDRIAASTTLLSKEATELIEDYLDEQELEFTDLNDSRKHIIGIQEQLFDYLKNKLLESDSSGAFVLLDASVNTKIAGADQSRTGLYLQRSSLDFSDNSILLYRGDSELGKANGVLPHRKWRLEFRTDMFPNYEELVSKKSNNLETGHFISDIFTLPDTSERGLLVMLPILGNNNEWYGICGFEINESYFKSEFMQPSKLDRATYVFEVDSTSEKEIAYSNSYYSGILGGYYLSPASDLIGTNMGEGLLSYKGRNDNYIGVTRYMQLTADDRTIGVSIVMPKSDYETVAFSNMVKIVTLVIFMILFSIICCVFFTQRYLAPLMADIDKLRSGERSREGKNYEEIADLFDYLADLDDKNEQALAALESEKQLLEEQLVRVNQESEYAKRRVEHLSYSRKNEVDPEAYDSFVVGVKMLSPMERKVYDYYLQGKRVKEIMELTGVKESTIRFHNKNIYSKLGVNSLKQLLLYASVMEKNS